MRSFILGTDWWTDCDDAVAVRMLARAHKNKEICIKAIGINACMEHSVTSLEGFLNTEGVRDIPLGIDMDGTDFGGNPPYQKRLSSFSDKYTCNGDAEDAVRLYRRILAGAEDKTEIIEIGYPQVLANLLMSGADDISGKSGLELMREKVSKVWMMAGKWDEENGLENNFCRNERSREAAEVFCRCCPVPVTFLGWEIGYDVISGGNLEKDDVLHNVLCDHGSDNGRSSWDPMLVLMAINGDEEKSGYDTVCGTASVDAKTGANNFAVSADGPHMYVTKKFENDYYKDKINDLIK